ncbi:MAG: DEAD/DEAH box helicase family protein [Acidobacteriota bacterium]
MKSINFEFLQKHRPELASLGGFAESYAYPDPSSALVKLRDFAEQIVLGIYSHSSLPKPFNASLYNLINAMAFRNVVPAAIIIKLDLLRKIGNKAAHGGASTTAIALNMLPEAYDLARWLYITFYDGKSADCAAYVQPTGKTIAEEATEQLKREKKEILEKLAAQEVQMQQLLAQLEQERNQKQAVEKTAAELEQLLLAGNRAVNELQFDEATTRRRLVDALLVASGWNVGESLQSTEEVGQGVKVDYQPTDTGIGYADYVLWGDNGRPLAVIEAKKTAESPEKGRTQAKFYADGLEKMYGQRPVIFYTNGIEVYIWNDTANEPPRKLYGFYQKDSLEYLFFQRQEKLALDRTAHNPAIADRMYQVEAIKRITERFSTNHRKALIVQATGTGKTRVAVSLCDLLIRARWAKRILFLCDRRELRKQANNVFKEFLSSEPRTYVTASTSKDRDKRIYLATYPAMMKCYESFDVGFFDLIIADESHRSIYNRYRDLFLYFDSLQVGLTATPVNLISRNTYRLFDCENENPTSYFSYEKAIEHDPPYLVPFEVFAHTTEFHRKGIKYSEMTETQRRELEEGEGNPETIEYESEEIDKQIFNKDTNRAILRNLMENGIREATGTRPGKSIIFARNHNHAILLQYLFDEMYPQYGGQFCRVIDDYDPRAEQLIDDFKGQGTNPLLTIAISVDMLDTGIDIPEIVNLVFAKPVKSYVKFWQMIGRGTRLCPNLFSPGQNKTCFRIFDHWKNFEFFEQNYREVDTRPAKSLLQKLFEARIRLVETALEKADVSTFDLNIDLLARDIAALPETTISVKEKWREIKTVQQGDTLKAFSGATKTLLLRDIAPLMQWRDTRGHEEAYELDLLIAELQNAFLKKSASFSDHKDTLLDMISRLPININQVREKIAHINRVKADAFWENITVEELEKIRNELRGIMKHQRIPTYQAPLPKIIDVTEDSSKIEYKKITPKLEGMELVTYRQRVEGVLTQLFDQSETLQKIKAGQSVTEADLRELCSLVLAQSPDLDLELLKELYPDTAGHLDYAIRRIIGLDAAAVHERFEKFVHEHLLNSKQISFLSLLENHIAKYGAIELDRLYEVPFTSVDSNGIDGVFNDTEVNELIGIINTFKPSAPSANL